MDPTTNWSKLKRFDSLEAGLDYSASNLSRRLKEANGDLGALAARYAPVGATNDPTGLNKNWARGVNTLYNRIKPAMDES